MKRLTLFALLSFITYPLLALETDGSGAPKNMKTLFQCGVGTERGFEGWQLKGIPDETYTYFEKDHLELFQHRPGNYSVELSKRIEDLVGYTDIRISAELAEIENCKIHQTTAYLSKDGKKWEALQTDVRNGADLRNEKMDYSFVRLVANVTFFKEGRFRINRTDIFGSYRPDEKLSSQRKTSLSFPAADFDGSTTYEEFNLFGFQKHIFIETKNARDYQIVLSNLEGEELLRYQRQGSQRIDVDVPSGIYLVTVYQNGQMIKKEKLVL